MGRRGASPWKELPKMRGKSWQIAGKSRKSWERPTGWSDLVMRFWTETGGANRKSFLPVKKALKLWRGAGKKKGQKKKNSRTQTVTVRHNLDLNMLNLQKALGFLAELHKTEVQDCIQKTTKPPDPRARRSPDSVASIACTAAHG